MVLITTKVIKIYDLLHLFMFTFALDVLTAMLILLSSQNRKQHDTMRHKTVTLMYEKYPRLPDHFKLLGQ